MATKPEQPHVPISKRLILINSVSGIATRILTVGVFAWVIQYLIKRIPETELALLPIMGSIALALPLLQSILTSGLSRHVTESYARNDMDGVTRIVSSQFPLLLVGSIVLMLVGGLIAWRIDDLLRIPESLVDSARFMTLLIVGRLAISIAVAPFNTGLFAKQKFVLTNAIDISSSLMRIGLMVGLILGISPRVEWVILAQVVSQLFGQIVTTIVSMRMLPALRFRPGFFDWATCKWALSFSTWSFVAEAATLIRRAADAPILNWFSTPVAVNDFFLGSTFESQLRQMAITASQPLLPALTAMHARDQHQRLAAAYLRGGRIALWASLFLAVPLIVFAHPLFQLYLGDMYPQHADAATVMILLLLGFPFTYPSIMYLRIAVAKGNIRPIAIRSMIVQLANLALTLWFVARLNWGAVGSASATLATFVVGYPLLFWPLAIDHLELSWRRFFKESFWPGVAPAIVSGCAAWIAGWFFQGSNIQSVAIGIPIALLVYGVVLLRVLQPADRADLNRVRRAAWPWQKSTV